MNRGGKIRMAQAIVASCALALLGMLAGYPASSVQAQGQSQSFEETPGGPKVLEEGQPPAWVHATVDQAERLKHGNGQAHAGGGASTTSNLSYRGGIGGVGVETGPTAKVYLVVWGSQWGTNGSKDPSGEVGILQTFLPAASGSSWLDSVTQYCQGVALGTVLCNGAGAAATNQLFTDVWFDDGSPAPSRPRQSQFANEAVRAASHFSNTSASANAHAQYVIATASRNNSTGFGSSYCAYHSSTSSAYGNIAYTNLPYITDAGASCGANFNGLGPKAGITIVEGHELAETITDQFPNGGWLDPNGEENGDKCAWISTGQGASALVAFGSGSFPVQSLWSNAFNGAAGGCVQSYP